VIGIDIPVEVRVLASGVAAKRKEKAVRMKAREKHMSNTRKHLRGCWAVNRGLGTVNSIWDVGKAFKFGFAGGIALGILSSHRTPAAQGWLRTVSGGDTALRKRSRIGRTGPLTATLLDRK
jgi:hypothetical protein